MKPYRTHLASLAAAVVQELPFGEPASRSAWKRAYKRLRARASARSFPPIPLAIHPNPMTRTLSAADGSFCAEEGGTLELRARSFEPAFGHDVVVRFDYDGTPSEIGFHFDFGEGLAPLPGFPTRLVAGENAIAFRMPRGVRQLVVHPPASVDFTIRSLRLEQASNSRKRRPVEDALTMLDHAGGVVPIAGFAFDGATRRFRTVGPDPQFRLLAPPLHEGFYMLEVQERFERTRCVARLYARTDRTEMLEDDAFVLPLRSGQLTKRLVRFTGRPKSMRFDPVEHSTPLTVDRFALVPVTDRFAYRRMLEKLGRGDVARAKRELEADARATDRAPIDLAFERYDAAFRARAHPSIRYDEWIATVESATRPDREALSAALGRTPDAPTISILLPVYDPLEADLRACLESVLAQSYPRWELCIADDASRWPHARAVIEEFALRDPRIRVSYRDANGGIAAASNAALELASGAFVALLDHDDTLDRDALLLVADALVRRPAAEIVYSDEDKIDRDGKRCDPHFKPEWNRELLYGRNYVSHLGVYRRGLVTSVGGFRAGFDGSQDYDLLLRCIERIDASDIVHVPHVLYHWRMATASTAATEGAKDYTTDATLRALREHLERRGVPAEVSSHKPSFFRVHWPLPPEPPLVSVIVPTRNGGPILRRAIESILAKTLYPNLELIVVDNQSSQAETLAYLDELARRPSVEVVRYDHPFNFAAINNFAVARARGPVIALVNDDVEVISPSWLDEMVALAVRADTGCVGAKLYYPNDTIQHAGVVTGLGGVAGHSHKHAPSASAGYAGRLWIPQEVSAVTAACLVMRKSVFDEVGGFDAEHLAVAFNDVDLCLRTRAAGYRNVFTPFAELYHHESVSRGSDESPENRGRFAREVDLMKTRWRAELERDPAYSVHLTLDREDFSLATRARNR